jgi:hypothetical protein
MLMNVAGAMDIPEESVLLTIESGPECGVTSGRDLNRRVRVPGNWTVGQVIRLYFAMQGWREVADAGLKDVFKQNLYVDGKRLDDDNALISGLEGMKDGKITMHIEPGLRKIGDAEVNFVRLLSCTADSVSVIDRSGRGVGFDRAFKALEEKWGKPPAGYRWVIKDGYCIGNGGGIFDSFQGRQTLLCTTVSKGMVLWEYKANRVARGGIGSPGRGYQNIVRRCMLFID